MCLIGRTVERSSITRSKMQNAKKSIYTRKWIKSLVRAHARTPTHTLSGTVSHVMSICHTESNSRQGGYCTGSVPFNTLTLREQKVLSLSNTDWFLTIISQNKRPNGLNLMLAAAAPLEASEKHHRERLRRGRVNEGTLCQRLFGKVKLLPKLRGEKKNYWAQSIIPAVREGWRLEVEPEWASDWIIKGASLN